MRTIVVTGAGGFIGHHMVKYLKESTPDIRVAGIDIKRPEFEESPADDFLIWDLRKWDLYGQGTHGIVAGDIEQIYHFAADMGGIGYITSKLADIAMNNSLININVFRLAREREARIFFSSSACVYRQSTQRQSNISPLKEGDAWPAEPEKGYGLEKLYAEELLHYLRVDYGMSVRIARFHNVYGPLGTWEGGKEKAPAALCRKVAAAEDGGTIEVWGDGKQTRSFMYIDDCILGIHRLMESDFVLPLNLGREEMISVNRLAEIIIGISGKELTIVNDLTKPQGVRGRNSDNMLCRSVLGGWVPEIPVVDGLRPTYEWIAGQTADGR